MWQSIKKKKENSKRNVPNENELKGEKHFFWIGSKWKGQIRALTFKQVFEINHQRHI